ncbi:hypothetical protein H5410_001397, partial [Solanum commersonii]
MMMSHIAWGCLDEMEACLQLERPCCMGSVGGQTRGDKIRSEVIRERWEWPAWWTSEGGETKMVWTCEEAGLRRPVRECEGGTWLASPHEDMTLDRKEWRCIKVV